MKRGYTLLEMLVVVLIIAILVSIAVPQYFNVVENARVVELKVLWGPQKGFAAGKELTEEDLAKANARLQKFGLKNFTGQIVCREDESSQLPCFEAVFTRNPGVAAQYQITTVYNFRELACVPLNLLGSRFCKSRAKPNGQITVDGKEAYLIH